MANIDNLIQGLETDIFNAPPDKKAATADSLISSLESPDDLIASLESEFPVEKPRFGSAFVAGLRGAPPEMPESPREFVETTLPTSAGRMTAGIPHFMADVGKTIVANPAATLGKALGIVPMAPGETVSENVKKDAQKLWELAQGFGKFALDPTGINLQPESGKMEDIISLENLKKAWGAAPIESVLGTLLLKHQFGKEKAKPGDKPRAEEPPVQEAPVDATDAIIERILAAETPQSGKVAVKGPVGLREAPVLREAPPEPPLTEVEIARIQEAKTAEARARGILPDPNRMLTSEEVTRIQASLGRAAAAKELGREGAPILPKTEAEIAEIAKAFEALDSKVGEVQTITQRLRAEQGQPPKRPGLLEEPVPPALERGGKLFEVQRRIEELNELRRTAETVSGQNLESLYRPVIRELIDSLPLEQRLIVEKQLAKEPLIEKPVGIPSRVRERITVEERAVEPEPPTAQPVSTPTPKTPAEVTQKTSAEVKPEVAPTEREVLLQDFGKEPVERRRRANAELRKMVDEVKTLEDFESLPADVQERIPFIDTELTLAPNKFAYKLSEKSPTQATIDAEGLKYANDNIGPRMGDALLKAIADVGNELGFDIYRLSGDEFAVQFKGSVAEASKAMEQFNEALKNKEITAPDLTGKQRTFKGFQVTYGVGPKGKGVGLLDPLKHAEQDFNTKKKAAQQAGTRAKRGEAPVSLVEVTKGKEGPVEKLPIKDVVRERAGLNKEPKPDATPEEAIEFNKNKVDAFLEKLKAEEPKRNDTLNAPPPPDKVTPTPGIRPAQVRKVNEQAKKQKVIEGPTREDLEALERDIETGKLGRVEAEEVPTGYNIRVEASRKSAHSAALEAGDIAGAELVRRKFEEYLRTIDPPRPAEVRRIYDLLQQMKKDEQTLREDPLEVAKRSKVRRLRRATAGGITRKKLDDNGFYGLETDAATALERMNLLNELILERSEQKAMPEPKPEPIVELLKGDDGMVLSYLRDKYGDNGTRMFETLDVDGKKKIRDMIYGDQFLWEKYKGKNNGGSTGNMLTDESGFINLSDAVDFVKRIKDTISLDILPRMSKYSVEGVDKSVDHAAANISVPKTIDSLIANAMPTKYKDVAFTSKIKDLMNKDNVLDGYDTFLEYAEIAEVEGKKAEAQSWYDAAKQIAEKHDISAYDKEIRDSMKDPEIVDAMMGIKAEINPLMDRLYNEVRGVDPNAPLDGRGKYYGVRTNLVTKEIVDQWSASKVNETITPPEFPEATNYKNPYVKFDPFTLSAKFTGEYSTNLADSLSAVLMRRYNEVTKIRMYKQLMKDGVMIESKQGARPPREIKGEESRYFEISLPTTDAKGNYTRKTVGTYVPKSLVPELRQVLETDIRGRQNRVLKKLNAIQLAQLVDGVYHTKNLVTEISRAQGAGKAWADITRKLPAIGQADAVGRILKVIKEIEADTPEIRREIAEMARQGWVRRAHYSHGKLGKTRDYIAEVLDKSDIPLFNLLGKIVGAADMGKIIFKVDTAGRIVMNRFYSNLVERGLAKETPKGRREFNNQLGNYNRKLMGYWMSQFRDFGAAPFIVAGRNFNRQGIRWLTGRPGVDSASKVAEMKLRMINLTGTAAFFVIPAMLNMLTTGNPNGRPGTKIGEWDLGEPPDEKGKHKTWDIMQLSGIRRGARLTGLNSLIEGIHEDRDMDFIINEAWHEGLATATHPWRGPGVGFVFEGIFDVDIDEFSRGGMRIPEGGLAQTFENFRAAGERINPTAYSAMRPWLRDLGIDKSIPDPEEKGFWETALLQAPVSALGARDRATPAYYEAGLMFKNRGLTMKDTEERQAARVLRNSMYGKSDDEILGILDNAMTNGIVTEKEADTLWKNKDLSPLARVFKPLTIKAPIYEAAKVWDKATPDEKLEIADLMEAKIENAWKAIPENQEEEFLRVVTPILMEIEEAIESGGFTPTPPPDSKKKLEPEASLDTGFTPEPERISHTQTENVPPTLLGKAILEGAGMIKETFPLAFPSEAEKIAKMTPQERQARAIEGTYDIVAPVATAKALVPKTTKVLGGMKSDVKIAISSIKQFLKGKGIKDEEMKWLKIDGLVEDATRHKVKSMSAEDLQTHIEGVMPEVKVIRKGVSPSVGLTGDERARLIYNATDRILNDSMYQISNRSVAMYRAQRLVDKAKHGDQDAISELVGMNADPVLLNKLMPKFDTPTKFEGHKAIKLGGDNYREVLYQVRSESPVTAEYARFEDSPEFNRIMDEISDERASLNEAGLEFRAQGDAVEEEFVINRLRRLNDVEQLVINALRFPTDNNIIGLEKEKDKLIELLRTTLGDETGRRRALKDVSRLSATIEEAKKLQSIPLENRSFTTNEGSHWDEPDVVAHARLDDRVDAEGKKGTLVQEIQSDWHRVARARGDARDLATLETALDDAKNNLKRLEDEFSELAGERVDFYEMYDWMDHRFGTATAPKSELHSKLYRKWRDASDWEDEIYDLRREYNDLSRAVPDPPFKDWAEFSMKNVLNDVVAKGDDRIYWVTGKQTKDLYSLSKHVDYITWKPSLRDDKSIYVEIKLKKGKPSENFYMDPNGVITEHNRWKDRRLEDVVGKDVAEKILKNEGTPKKAQKDIWGLDDATRIRRDAMAAEQFKAHGISLDTASSGGTVEYKLRKWKAPHDDPNSYVSPDTLPPELRKIWNILTGEGDEVRAISGLDLDIGGKWALELYDRRIPAFIKKQGGNPKKIKLPDAKAPGRSNFVLEWEVMDSDTGEIVLTTTNPQHAREVADQIRGEVIEPIKSEDVEVWYSDITPKMKKKVEEGQEMFANVPIGTVSEEEEDGLP